ncbi:DUF2007 domain-containing protein [Flammeovirgaceae bacterium SG7u.111]|nr:DUF2007 domain-containing protein [Flammeovirgaceae bacterium SG7u.132]WPO35399.1 DUF2007 domain-containing protein [Flammeovirgaceae bacterium SG7u.111]
MSNWKKVYSTTNLYQAELVKTVLEGNNITSIIMDKRDSSYNNFGEKEVYVTDTDVLEALKIIENEVTFE